jgi:hypothetical protein
MKWSHAFVHFNKILVVFRCFGEIKKLYVYLGLSGIFTDPLRVFLGNMGVFCEAEFIQERIKNKLITEA